MKQRFMRHVFRVMSLAAPCAMCNGYGSGALTIPRLLLRLGVRVRSVWKICEKVETGGVAGLGYYSLDIVPVILTPLVLFDGQMGISGCSQNRHLNYLLSDAMLAYHGTHCKTFPQFSCLEDCFHNELLHLCLLRW